jgi:hypothetical protein
MSTTSNATEGLNREYLGIRARLIEVAAALDRIDRASGSTAGDPRMDQIRRSLAILSGQQSDRTEQIQMLFSLPYESDWKARYAIPGPAAGHPQNL